MTVPRTIRTTVSTQYHWSWLLVLFIRPGNRHFPRLKLKTTLSQITPCTHKLVHTQRSEGPCGNLTKNRTQRRGKGTWSLDLSGTTRHTSGSLPLEPVTRPGSAPSWTETSLVTGDRWCPLFSVPSPIVEPKELPSPLVIVQGCPATEVGKGPRSVVVTVYTYPLSSSRKSLVFDNDSSLPRSGRTPSPSLRTDPRDIP